MQLNPASICSCGACGAKLRLRQPYQIALGIGLAGCPAAGLLVAPALLGLMSTFGSVWIILGTAALVSGAIVFPLYLVQGSKLRAALPGEPGVWRYHLRVVLWGGLGLLSLCLVVGAGTFAAMMLAGPLLFQAASPRFPSGEEPTVLGKAEEAWTLQTLDGKDVQFASFHGKVIFLNRWATWCGPCVSEIPSIERLAESVKGEDVVFLLVSDESPQLVRAFVEKKGLQVPVYVSRSKVPALFTSHAIPATFIVNRRGEIVFQHIGSANWDSDDGRRFLRSLL
jgi:thiol-disulfide isomerase/thioredoxin